MKTKLFTLFLMLAASIGSTFAEITVRLDSQSCPNWSVVYLYAFTPGGSALNGFEYPGVIVSKDNDGWYSYTFDSSISTVNVMWNTESAASETIKDIKESICCALNDEVGWSIKITLLDCSDKSPLFYEHIKIGDLYYNLNNVNNTAEVTSENLSNNYSGLTVANIPITVDYNNKTYTVTSIGDWAFYDCSGLTSITIPDSVTSIGQYAFRICSGLTSVTIPNNVTTIGGAAFSGSGLTSVTIPNSVTSIGEYAFGGCSGLTSVTIGKNVTSIEREAFVDCSNIKTIIWNAKNCNSCNFGSQVTSFVFGNEVDTIPYNCCRDMTNLTSVTIPNSVTSIGSSAFRGCGGLTSITIPNSVISIGETVFSGCTELSFVTIGDSVANIAQSVFYNCTNIRQLVAPAQAFNIPESEWPSYTKQLDSIVINNGELSDNVLGFVKRSYKTLKTIDVSAVSNSTLPDEAFKECYNLCTLILPANLTEVSYMAVAECVKLTAIDIPASVTEIGDRAFEDCRSLKTITFGGNTPSAIQGRVFLPAETSHLRKIGNWAFYNAHELLNLEIPEGVTEIGDGAFYGCTYLENLTLPSSVRAIGDNCFALCRKLNRISVGATTPPTIQTKTFYDVLRRIPVYVPDECVNVYKTDELWGEFNIVGKSEIPLGVEEINAFNKFGTTTKFIHNGQLYIRSDAKIYIATGQEVR